MCYNEPSLKPTDELSKKDNMKTEIKLIIAGATLFVLGAFVIPLATVLPLILRDSSDDQFKVPGTTQVKIEEPGSYYLWNDYQTVFEGKSYNRSQNIPDGIEITLQNKETGEKFNFISDTSISSSSGSSSKNSIGYIEVQTPGTVEISISGGDEERVFSFSRSDLLLMFGMIFGGLALSMLIGFSGFGLTIWGIVKLVQSKK